MSDEKPPEKFADLPAPVREFLVGLRAEEVAFLAQAIRFFSAASMLGRFAAWLIGGLVAALLGAWGVIEVVGKMLASLKGAR